jgi:hypothetical protein
MELEIHRKKFVALKYCWIVDLSDHLPMVAFSFPLWFSCNPWAWSQTKDVSGHGNKTTILMTHVV